MNDGIQITVQDVLQKLSQHGFKDCTKEMTNQCDRPYLYVFERVSDESGVHYGCETESDLFALLSLVEASDLTN
jgi:hypothetical protein